jgi:hypothetical protein
VARGDEGVAVVLLATGCLSLTNHSQSCTSSGGFMGPSEFSCSGTAETVKGEGPLSFDGEDDDDPDYRMDLSVSVESGTMDVFASTVDGGREGGGRGLAGEPGPYSGRGAFFGRGRER